MGTIGYGYGSEWHLMLYLARRRAALTHLVEQRVGVADLRWLDYSEGRDRKSGAMTLRETKGLEFLPDGHVVRESWEALWPQSGNVHNWDAVAHSAATDAWVLVEAKAHVGELVSSCGAKAAKSLRRIREVLDSTRERVGASASSDWLTGHYQYANRLALLDFLRDRGVNAHLLFVYFIGDRVDLGVRGRECPVSQSAWAAAFAARKKALGYDESASLLRFVHDLFLPVYRIPVGTSE